MNTQLSSKESQNWPHKVYDDGTYRRHNPGWHSEDAHWKASKIIDLLREHRIVPRSVCDIGCGTGKILDCLDKELNSQVEFVGYDISVDALAGVRQHEKPNFRYIHGGFPPEGQVAFDVAMAIDVFEHVEDYFGFLRRLRGVGHYKIFHIPLDLSVQGVLRASPLRVARESVGHLHYFTKETALATLHDVGFDVLDQRFTCKSLDLPAERLRTKLMATPRRLLSAVSPSIAARLLGGFSLLVLAV